MSWFGDNVTRDSAMEVGTEHGTIGHPLTADIHRIAFLPIVGTNLTIKEIN